MAKTNLEIAIEQAASSFALEVIEAIKGATLQELSALQSSDAPVQARRKPGPKPGKRRGPGRPPKRETAEGSSVDLVPLRKKRVVKNYPKCAFPGCNKNRFVRGKGFCGEHWRSWKAGKIKSAEYYKKQEKK